MLAIEAGVEAFAPDQLVGEEKFNIKFLNAEISQWGRLQQNGEIWPYISQNYDIALVGLLRQGDNFIPTNFLLKKGRPLNLTLVESLQPVKARDYELPRGKVEFYVIESAW